jgi:hypothetical protein
MTKQAIPADILSACRRRLMAQIDAGQQVSLGSLAAELDLTPPAALAALHRTVVVDLLPIRAELLIACPSCDETVQLVTGLAAWILAAHAFQVPCTCGETFSTGPSYLDLVLVPSVARNRIPHAGAKQVAESARPLSTSVVPVDGPEQLSMGLDLNL